MSIRRYRKAAAVLAERATEAGVISTPEGDMHFAAGDYLVTDSPPTHAWPVKREVFERTYVDFPAPPVREAQGYADVVQRSLEAVRPVEAPGRALDPVAPIHTAADPNSSPGQRLAATGGARPMPTTPPSVQTARVITGRQIVTDLASIPAIDPAVAALVKYGLMAIAKTIRETSGLDIASAASLVDPKDEG